MYRAAPFREITSLEAKPLPIGFRALSFARYGPRLIRGGARRLLLSRGNLVARVPETLIRFPDGREFVCPRHDRMYAAVLCDGMWEPLETTALLGLLRPGDFAVDVGANHGWHTIGMASAVGAAGLVWAAEPVPEIADSWRRNLARNPGLNARLFTCALAANAGSVTLHVFSGLPEGHASMSTLGREDYISRAEIPARTLDDLIAEAHRTPAMIKIDVEGADLGVLQGGMELAAHHNAPMWLLEVNREVSKQFGYEPRALLARLDSAGAYTTYRLTRDGPVKESNPSGAPHGAAWLAVPDGHLDRLEAFERGSKASASSRVRTRFRGMKTKCCDARYG